jgi:hypothetical protein
VSGLALDLVGHAGLVSASGTLLVACLSAGTILSGRVVGRAATGMVAIGGTLGLLLTLRASPWVVAPVLVTALILLLLGASLGSDGSGIPTTPSDAAIRTATSAAHLALAPGALRRRPGDDRPSGPRRWPSLARGATLAFVVCAPLMTLLASADPIFHAWLDLPGVARHALLVLAGGWLLLGLVRASSSTRDVRARHRKRRIGKVEAACALGAVAALYGAFVVAQLVALSGGGRHVLTTRGLTYAQYARSGFVQLLACAAFTMLVILVLRSHTGPSADSSVLRGLSGTVALLTLGIVIAAMERLRLYQDAYGLTMLRLAALVASSWIGAMFVLLTLLLAVRSVRAAVAKATLVVTLATVAGWAVVNPAAMVARTNLDRAARGHPFDAGAAAALGADAVPTLTQGTSRLDGSTRRLLLEAVCGEGVPRSAALSSYNAADDAATKARAKTCTAASPRRP